MLSKIEKLDANFNEPFISNHKVNELIDTVNLLIDEIKRIEEVKKERSIEYCITGSPFLHKDTQGWWKIK